MVSYPGFDLSKLGHLLTVGILLVGLVGCQSGGGQAANQAEALPAEVPVLVEVVNLRQPTQTCPDTFSARSLDHETTVPGGETVREFEANGGGVAIDDLDNDGDLDIVLANQGDLNTILWNEGELNFTTEHMPIGDSRAVNLVDLDGDGWLDILLTRRMSAPNYWRNLGRTAEPASTPGQTTRFEQTLLPGLAKPAYAMAWADFDQDGDLDLVTGSYDAALLLDLGNDFLVNGGGGVYYYENRDGRFEPTMLAPEAQALALTLFDVNGDDHPDLTVGNDFAVPDQTWVWQAGGWIETQPFVMTSHSTMGFDYGDIDNNGQAELFATDMKPYDHAPETQAAWAPIIAGMLDDEPASTAAQSDTPQTMENVLQVQRVRDGFANESGLRGVDATGWSWSAKFGDLNRDGFLDLYVVNGMIEQRRFGHLPNHELVEANQVFNNDGKGRFLPMPGWNLGSIYSGRGMSMADLDEDGDLDIVVNNLRAPAQLFENKLCGGPGLEVDLFWPGSGNTRAIGATVTLFTQLGRNERDVRSGSGYLSGDPARLHFGLRADARPEKLEIRWPDGAVSTIAAAAPQTLLKITR